MCARGSPSSSPKVPPSLRHNRPPIFSPRSFLGPSCGSSSFLLEKRRKSKEKERNGFARASPKSPLARLGFLRQQQRKGEEEEEEANRYSTESHSSSSSLFRIAFGQSKKGEKDETSPAFLSFPSLCKSRAERGGEGKRGRGAKMERILSSVRHSSFPFSPLGWSSVGALCIQAMEKEEERGRWMNGLAVGGGKRDGYPNSRRSNGEGNRTEQSPARSAKDREKNLPLPFFRSKFGTADAWYDGEGSPPPLMMKGCGRSPRKREGGKDESLHLCTALSPLFFPISRRHSIEICMHLVITLRPAREQKGKGGGTVISLIPIESAGTEPPFRPPLPSVRPSLPPPRSLIASFEVPSSLFLPLLVVGWVLLLFHTLFRRAFYASFPSSRPVVSVSRSPPLASSSSPVRRWRGKEQGRGRGRHCHSKMVS